MKCAFGKFPKYVIGSSFVDIVKIGMTVKYKDLKLKSIASLATAHSS